MPQIGEHDMAMVMHNDGAVGLSEVPFTQAVKRWGHADDRHGPGQCPLHQPQRQRRTLTPILIRSRSASRRHLTHSLHDLFRVIRLLQGQTARHWTGRYRRKPSRIDHWQSGVMLATAFGDRPPVDGSRQLNVGDQHIRDPPPAPRQRLFALPAWITWCPSSRSASTTSSRIMGSSSTTSARTGSSSTP